MMTKSDQLTLMTGRPAKVSPKKEKIGDRETASSRLSSREVDR